MTFTAESGGASLNIPYAPQEVSHTSVINDWVSIPRPGLMENVVYGGPMRPKMSFDLVIHDKRVLATSGATTLVRAITVVQTLISMAKKGRVRISYGAMESGLWWISDLQVKTTKRDPLTDEMIGATVSMSLIRNDSGSTTSHTGPTTGGWKTASSAASTVAKTVSKSTTPATRTYTVKRGDTLWKIAAKFYGDGSKWGKIATANKITDPRKLPTGKVLRIP